MNRFTQLFTLVLTAALVAFASGPVHASIVGATDLDYGISNAESNGFGLDFTGQSIWTAGSNRSDNGLNNNSRAGRVFIDFQLTSAIIAAANTVTSSDAFLTFTVDSIGGGVSGTPYTDGLDLRFLGVSGSDRSANTLWNTAGVGIGDQADILATTDAPGTYKITLTNAAVKSAIAGASAGQYLSFGLSNSVGVTTDPVGNSTAETYGFQMDTSTTGYELEVIGTHVVMPTGITQTQSDTLGGGWSPTHLIDGTGLSGPVNINNYASVTHTNSSATGWVTNINGGFPNNYFSGSNPEPQFVIDLGQSAQLTALLVWGYGGNTNEASDFLVEFSTDGGATWSLDTETVATSALLGDNNELLEFAGVHWADTVRLTITENAAGRGFPGTGGDRVGFGELKFIAYVPTPAALPAGLLLIGFAAARLRKMA